MKTTTLVTATFATLSCYSELVTAGSTDNHVLLISPQRFEEQDWQHQGCYVSVMDSRMRYRRAAADRVSI